MDGRIIEFFCAARTAADGVGIKQLMSSSESESSIVTLKAWFSADPVVDGELLTAGGFAEFPSWARD